MKYIKNYCEEKRISTSELTESQRTLYYIAENMKMDKSISEEGYRHFQMAIKALEQQPSEDCVSREQAIRVAEQGQIQGYEWQFKKLCTLPSATPQPKVGRWIKIKREHYNIYKCSQCSCVDLVKGNYCRSCGSFNVAKIEVNDE